MSCKVHVTIEIEGKLTIRSSWEDTGEDVDADWALANALLPAIDAVESQVTDLEWVLSYVAEQSGEAYVKGLLEHIDQLESQAKQEAERAN